MKNSDFKKSIKEATEKYIKKNTETKNKRHNEKPELETQNSCIEYLKSINCDGDVFEAKATFSQEKQRFVSAAMKSGIVDWGGNFPNGLAIWIEFKAKGKLKTIRENQRNFLIRKISTNCFAVCVDSLECLKKHIEEFKKSDNRKKYLLSVLPEPYKSKSSLGEDQETLF